MVSQSTGISDISLGLGLLSSLGPKVDDVGIYSNGSGNDGVGAIGLNGVSSSVLNSILGIPDAQASIGQIFRNARPVRAIVRETSKVMEHPVESGVMLSDHHVINPVEIDLQLIVTSTPAGVIGDLLGVSTATNYATTYSLIRQAFLNATPLAVKTRVGVYSNMIIQEMPHEENPDMYDVITINLRLKQVIYIVPGSTGPQSNYQPLAANDSNTLSSGLQQAGTIGSQILSSASGVASFAAVAKKGFL